MEEQDKYAPGKILLDRMRTQMAMDRWREEAMRRARDDIRLRMTGQCFRGIEQDPNAAFTVGVMQKYFLKLASESSAVVYVVPCIRANHRHVMGVLSLREEELGDEAREALLILQKISDDYSVDRGREGMRRYRFSLYDVWSTFEVRGNSYRDWIRMTYGDLPPGSARLPL